MKQHADLSSPPGAQSKTAVTPGDDAGRRIGLLPLCGLGLAVGIIGGLGAVIFRHLIGLVHNVAFLGQLSTLYDASVFTALSPWGAWIIVVPVVGSLCVTFLVVNFAPEAKGHGVPEVIDAIYYNRGIIRPVVGAVKALASALAIGTGAAVGREGPIIQIGASFGSTLGQLFRMQTGQRVTLVAAGAGAGIAATFNTPIGGVLFAVELMLPEISVDTFLPVAIATSTAAYVGHLFFGMEPAFAIPAALGASMAGPTPLLTLLLYAIIGALLGVAAAAFILGLEGMTTLFNRIPNPYLRHAIGMLLVGLLIYGMVRWTGHYYVEGVGYAMIQSLLQGHIQGVGFLLMLFAAKLLAFNLSLGSGSSGGVFSPALFMGAALGAAVSAVASAMGLSTSLPAFAIVGMGAMVGSSTGAAMTAVTMIFEMTRDYNIVLPMILAVAVALGTRRLFTPYTIYTLKLALRGEPVPSALQTNMFLIQRADQLMDRRVLVVDGATNYDARLRVAVMEGGLRFVVLTNAEDIIGVLRMDNLTDPDFVVVRKDQSMLEVLTALRRCGAMLGVVTEPNPTGVDAVIGIITKDKVADTVADSVQVYPG
jgi:CIC family chloride channel protein